MTDGIENPTIPTKRKATGEIIGQREINEPLL
jgi:hypothetical protein